MTKSSEVFGTSLQKNEMRETRLCCCGGGHQNHQMSNPDLKTVYQCPMKCEGEKTYNAPGSCPVCNMRLVPVNQIDQK
jgi:P-type Cu+ transporter